jgi:DNA (cytosine-5)-methyltransferase 1
MILTFIAKYKTISHLNAKYFTNLNFNDISLKVEKKKKVNASFKYHIPHFIVNAFRVELTNKYSDFVKNKYSWRAEIHYSQGPRAKYYSPKCSISFLSNFDNQLIDEFIQALPKSTAKKFQELYTLPLDNRQKLGTIGPEELLEMIAELLRKLGLFPLNNNECKKQDFKGMHIPEPIIIGYAILKKCIYHMKIS